MDVFWYMGLIKKLKKLNPQYFAEMKYPHYLNDLPIDEKAILLESQQGKDIYGNIWYIAKELMTNEEYNEYHIYISAKTREIADKTRRLIDSCGAGDQATVVKTFSDRYYRIVASAKYLFNDNTFASYFIKKDGQVYINTWHGTPLKTLGRVDKVSANMIGNVQKNFFFVDYMMCPNMFTYNIMVKNYMLENLCKSTVLINGYPRNTVLLDSKKREEVREKYGMNGYRVYAYMPTWRVINTIPKPEEKEYINQDYKEFVKIEKEAAEERISFTDATNYWLEHIDSLLEDDEIMYVKAHVKEADNYEQHKYKHIREFPSDIETYEFLVATDKLVTDYSSVMFDYALTGNKVVLFTYDREDYIKNRGLHMGLNKLPFPVVNDAEHLVNELRDDDLYDADQLLNDYCQYDCPDATGKLLARTIRNQDADLIEMTIPDNGKKNVMLYVGDLNQNGITAALRGLISHLDLERNNYYLNFQGTSVSQNKNVLMELPEEVKYISRIGKMPVTLKQNIYLRLYSHRLISLDKYIDVMRSAYELDIKRQFGDVKFDTIVQFTGYEYKKILTYSMMDARRLIFVHNNMINEKDTRNNQRLDVLRYAYNSYDDIIGVSEAMVQPTQEIAERPVAVNVIYNMINAARIRRLGTGRIQFSEYTESTIDVRELEAVLEEKGKVFISVGRFSPEKGHDRLVRAFNRYWKDHQDDYLIVLGGGQTKNGYKKLLKQVSRLASRNNIILIKRMDNPYALISRCDGMLLSSYYEGFGLVIAEGDILGLPVVSVDIDAPRPFMQANGGTLVENSENGVYEAFNLINEGAVAVMNANYNEMNSVNVARLEALL